MINRIVYENEKGMSIDLNHEGPLFIFEPKGFEGLESDIVSSQSAYQDGISVSKMILKDRLLTLNCYMCVDSEVQRNILKRNLYNAFNPSLKGHMEIYTDTTMRGASNLRVVQAPIFDNDYSTTNELVKFQVQLVMPLPFFEDLSQNMVEFGTEEGKFYFDLEIVQEGNELSSKNNMVVMPIFNGGDAETPLTVKFRAKAKVENPSITNIYTKEYIKINKVLEVGEEITITTSHGNKRVESSISGNLFNYLDLGSSFMWLDIGDNVIRYDADKFVEQLEVNLFYTNYYLGV